MEKYILMKALTGSEWDGVEFALLPFSEKRLNQFLAKKKVLDTLKDVDQLVVYSDDVEFFTDLSQLNNVDEDEENPIIVEINDIEELSRPEQTIKYGQIKFGKDEIIFSGYGKHTNEEYWCNLSYSRIETLTK